MTETLHPAVKQLFDPNKYEVRPDVEIFTEHELTSKTGKKKRVDKAELERIAKTNNIKAKNGALTLGGFGHTFDDTYDAKGNLISKAPEDQQPKPIAAYLNYHVAKNPHSGKYSLYADEHVQKKIIDDEGKEVDGLQYTASFPRRSAEYYAGESWIDFVAMIRRAPRLDLAVQMYAKADPEKAYYAKQSDGKEAPAYEFAKGKIRYSFDTGEAMEEMDETPDAPAPMADPTMPAEAGDTGGGMDQIETPENDGVGDDADMGDDMDENGLNSDHRGAAEAYARHMHGMHHSQVKPLMAHMHKMYAKDCGLPEDMHAEYSMAGPGAVLPQASAPKGPEKPEMSRMQKDQGNIEKHRYEKRIADMELELAEIRQKELYTHMERQLMQLVAEEYQIDAAEEMEICQKRKYSRQQFDERIEDLRRVLSKSGGKSPVGNYPRLSPESKPMSRENPVDGSTMTQQEFDLAQRYMRDQQRAGKPCDWEEAKQKYTKAS
jgi:hypothetical protein